MRVTVPGRHVTVTLPEDEPRLGEQLVTLGDRALERYAPMFGVELPREPIPVTIFVTDNAMDAVMQSARDPHHVVGATLPDGSVEFHLPLLGGPSPALPEGVGAYEWTFLHELAHALRHRMMPNSQDQPVWIQEGLADRLAECMLGGDSGPMSTIARARIAPFEKAIGTIQRIPVAKLLTTTERELHDGDAKTFALYYSESYYLNRYLDSGDRRSRFRALLAEIGRMPRALLATRLAARVRELFGDPAALDRALEASLRAEPEPPWVAIAGDVRPLGAGDVALVSVRDGSSSALIRQGPASLKRVSAVVDMSEAKQVSLFVIARSPNGRSDFPRDFCKVVFGSGSPVTLECWGGQKWSSFARGEMLRNVAGPRKLQLDSGEGRLSVRVDDEIVLEATTDKSFAIGPSGGAVGVGVDDGRAVFRDVRVE